ncbi:MAG: cbb3-type cytochrome c oxidase subunit I [Solirubrobacterales bacterium]
MEAIGAATRPAEAGGIAHPEAVELRPEPDSRQRLVGWLFAGTGLALFAVMGLLGLTMRLTQAEVISVSPTWFYRIMTLHGAGMLAGALLAMMGALWFVVRSSVPALGFGRVLWSYAAIVGGAVAIVVAVVIGGFAAGWTFLWPLPFDSAGQWSTWATAVALVGWTGVGVGFFLYCIDVLACVTATYGGFARALGVSYLRGRDPDPPPPQVLAATAITTQGIFASVVGTTIVVALLDRAIDSNMEIDALWAKNLTFFFGHSVANLIIYLAAGMVYVLLPRYAGRPWKTTKPIAIAWLATLLLVTTAYGHHLYMDFVQPEAVSVVSTVASSAAAIPVAVVTIYTGMMLVWGSRYRWTLASVLLYMGFAGWAIGGSGAVIDSVIPINFRFHNTLWVPGHFHTYLMLGVMFWVMAFVAHLLEQAAGRPASGLATRLAPLTMAVGGYGLVGVWYVSGALGVPRRWAVHPPGTSGYSLVASIFVIVFAVGFLILLLEFLSLGRDALRSRTASGRAPQPAIAGGSPEAAPPRQPPLRTPVQIAACVALGVAAGFVFLPAIQKASEVSIQWHHLAHALQFSSGALFGLALASTPEVFRRIPTRYSNAALAVVIIAPIAMLLMMTPSIYSGLSTDDTAHGAYHAAIFYLGLMTGAAAALMGVAAGRLLLVVSIGMGLMFAAGVTGG